MNEWAPSSTEPAADEPAAEAGYTFPWPPPSDASPADALLRTWRDSLFSPTRFFRAMSPAGSVGMALLYFLIVGVVATAFGLFWRSAFQTMLGARGAFSPLAPMLRGGLGGWSPLIGFLLSPVFLLLEIGVVFAVVHALLWVFGGARAGAATTFRVLCFAYGPQVFAIVPGLGSIVGFVWMLVLAIIGLREAHRTDAWRAALAVILPLVLVIGVTVVIAIIAAIAAVGFV